MFARLAAFLLRAMRLVPALWLALGIAQAAEISGEAPRAADGGSLVMDGRAVRLWGVSAPPLSLLCHDRSGQVYACGARARAALQAMIGARRVSCHIRSTVSAKTVTAACDAGGLDLGREMVREGWAVAEQRFDGYVADETGARAASLGLWAGRFRGPDEW